MTIDNIVMWVTQLNIAEWVYAVNSTPHTSHFLVDSQHVQCHIDIGSRTRFCANFIHVSSACCVLLDSLRLSLPLFAFHLLFHLPFHSPDHLHLPCGGQEPCALLRMRSHALLARTILSQVMSPTTSTSQRLLKISSRSPPATQGPRTCMTWTTMTIPSAERSLHHCSLRSEKNQREVDKLITLLKKVCRPVSRRLSVMLEQGDLFLISLIH